MPSPNNDPSTSTSDTSTSDTSTGGTTTDDTTTQSTTPAASTSSAAAAGSGFDGWSAAEKAGLILGLIASVISIGTLIYCGCNGWHM